MAQITDFTGAAGTNLTGSGAGTNLVLAAGSHAAGKLNGAGAAYLANTGPAARQIYLSPEAPATADYDAETVRVAPGYAFDPKQVVGVRYSADGLTGYEVEHDISGGVLRLYRLVGGVRTQVSSYGGYADRCRVSASGTGATVTVRVYLDDLLRITYDDTDAARITSTGRPGCGWVGAASATNTVTAGVNLDSFSSSGYTGVPANTAPTVAITRPAAESITVPAGTELVLRATATDVEDDDAALTSMIAWSSSNLADGTNGALGSGPSFNLDTAGWANGTRTIAASVTDAGGLQATPDSFTLTIGAGSTLILEDDVQQEILQGGVAATVRVALRDSTGAVLESNPLAPGDVKKSVDGGAAGVLAGDAGAAAWTVVNGFLNVPLSAAEVTGGEITLFIEDQDGSAFLDRVVKILVVGYDPRATPASTTQIAGAVGDALAARLAS